MKNIKVAIALVAACLCGTGLFPDRSFAAEEAMPTAPAGHVELFNGKDFTGWTCYLRSNAPLAGTWSVTNGVIHCTGRPPGYLRTEKSFRDYTLTVEWRFVKVAPRAENTGILLHMQLPEKVWPKCVEGQGMHAKQGEFWMQGGATCKGHDTPATRHVTTATAAPEKPVGEWNTYQAECAGSSVKVFINGEPMNEITECNVAAGFIGLQSEGAEIEVRKVYLDPLKPR